MRLSVNADVTVSNLELYNGNVESDLRAGMVPEVSEYTFSKIVSHVTEPLVLINGLIPSHEYLYSVKAINETYSSISAPSNKICFTTQGEAAGMDANIYDGVSLHGGDGGIDITLTRDNRIQIVTLSGVVVFEGAITSGTHHISLSPGFYIVHANTISEKCIVR